MTSTQHRNQADAIDAIERGEWETVQWYFKAADSWCDHEGPYDARESLDSERLLRLKPTLRPWSKPSDVPGPVCWLRPIRSCGQFLVLQIDAGGLCAGYSMVTSSHHLILWSGIAAFEHSTDRKTWHPCTVEEQP